MTDTYFDFDSETFQITQRKTLSESSGYSSSTPVLLSPSLQSQEHMNSSEDIGIDTSSEYSSFSPDGIPFESLRSSSPKNSSGQAQHFHCSLFPRTSLDSLISKSLNRHDSKESIKSSSSFWDSNCPPEMKASLTKIRDQMRSSLERVRELEEQAKQIPLLQVKISILQEEKRQLFCQLQTRTNLVKSRSQSGNTRNSRNSSTQDCGVHCFSGETRSIGIGDHSVHDIMCYKCKEIQDKLLKNSYNHQSGHGQWEDTTSNRTTFTVTSDTARPEKDIIKVFQDRCTQTRPTEHKDISAQVVIISADDPAMNESEGESSKVRSQSSELGTRTYKDCLFDPISVQTRCVGVGQMRSFVKDVCVGESIGLLTVKDFGAQTELQVATANIGIDASPTLQSVGTCISLTGKPFVNTRHHKYCSVGVQTVSSASSLVSTGVGKFPVDNLEDCGLEDSIPRGEISEPNQFNPSSRSVGVGTCPWADLKRKVILDKLLTPSTASVGVATSIITHTVGCGDLSVTDIACQRCLSKRFRSLGVSCTPENFEVSLGKEIPLSEEGNRRVILTDKPNTTSVGVGECCVTDNYCERCFSLHTRTIGVGNGSVVDDFVDGNDVTAFDLFNGSVFTDEHSDVILHHYNKSNAAQTESSQEKSDYQDLGNKPVKMDLTPVERMFSEEYERITDDWITYHTDDRLKHLTNPGEDILLACQLLQKHFQNEENLDENNLLICMKSIEDYWFSCVTEKSIETEFMSKLLELLNQNLPLLLDGVVNSQDENGNTALHYLVTHGKFDCVNELLKTDLCDLNITNKAGYSAVMLACLEQVDDKKDKIVLKHLFDKGNLNCVAQSTGQTALMLAAGAGRVDIVDLLIQCGAGQSINATDLDGSTALMCACEHGYAAVVKRLLAAEGCDASIADQDGSTCFSIAMEQNRKDIALIIYNHLQLQNTRRRKRKSSKNSTSHPDQLLSKTNSCV